MWIVFPIKQYGLLINNTGFGYFHHCPEGSGLSQLTQILFCEHSNLKLKVAIILFNTNMNPLK